MRPDENMLCDGVSLGDLSWWTEESFLKALPDLVLSQTRLISFAISKTGCPVGMRDDLMQEGQLLLVEVLQELRASDILPSISWGQWFYGKLRNRFASYTSANGFGGVTGVGATRRSEKRYNAVFDELTVRLGRAPSRSEVEALLGARDKGRGGEHFSTTSFDGLFEVAGLSGTGAEPPMSFDPQSSKRAMQLARGDGPWSFTVAERLFGRCASGLAPTATPFPRVESALGLRPHHLTFFLSDL